MATSCFAAECRSNVELVFCYGVGNGLHAHFMRSGARTVAIHRTEVVELMETTTGENTVWSNIAAECRPQQLPLTTAIGLHSKSSAVYVSMRLGTGTMKRDSRKGPRESQKKNNPVPCDVYSKSARESIVKFVGDSVGEGEFYVALEGPMCCGRGADTMSIDRAESLGRR